MATPSLKLNCLSTAGSSIFSVDENAGNNTNLITRFNNTTVSSSSSTGSVIFLGGISISSTTNASSNLVGGALTIAGGASVSQDFFANRISTGSFGVVGGTIGTLYFTSLTGANIAISGNATIGGDLLVLGQTTIVNLTTSNQIETNVTSTNIFLLNSLIAGFNSHTLGNIFTTGGNVGINTTTPGFTLDVTGTGRFTNNLSAISNSNTIGNIFTTGGNTGFNMTTPLSTIHVSKNITPTTSGSVNAAISISNGANGTAMNFGTRDIGVIGQNFSWIQAQYNNSANVTQLLCLNPIGGNVGIGNTAPAFTLDISGTTRITTSLTTGTLFSTNQTTTNIVGTAISAANISSTNISTASLYSLNQTTTNIVGMAISAANIIGSTNISTAALYSLNQTTTNSVFTSITTANIFTTNSITVPSILATTSLSTANVYSTNITSINLVSNFTSVGNLISSTGTFANNVGGSQTVGTIVVTTSASLIGNTNTIGNLFTTGGNVGINTTSPVFTLDVNGVLNVSTSITTGSIFSRNVTSTNIVSTNITSTNLNSTNITSTNIIGTNISTSSLIGSSITSTNFTTTNIVVTFISSGNIKMLANGNIVTNNENGNNHPIHIYSTVGPNSASSASLFLGPDSTNNISYIQTSKNGAYLNLCLNPRGGNVGINNTSPGATLDVTGTGRFTTSITTGNVYSTNITSINTVSTGITTTSLISNTNISTVNLQVTNISAATLQVSGNISAANSVATIGNLFSTNLVGTNSSFANSFITAITASSIIVNGITCGNAFFTSNVTVGGLFSTNITASSIFTSFITSSTLNVTGITAGTIFATIGLTCSTLLATTSTFPNTFLTNSTLTNTFITNETVTNSLVSNSSISNLIVSSSASLLFNSNTIGASLFTTGGNVGINTTSPGFRLDITGSARINNSTVYSSNSTTGALNILGGISIRSTNSSSTTAGGGLTIDGGGAISQDLYLGGNLFVQGINNSPITTNVLIGAISTTGVYQQTITFSRTMSNTNYKIIGNLTTVSANTNVYALTFTSLTTTTAFVNILRLDAMQAGSNITDLTLSYVIFP